MISPDEYFARLAKNPRIRAPFPDDTDGPPFTRFNSVFEDGVNISEEAYRIRIKRSTPEKKDS